jgi:hypothetical protein
MMEDLYPLVLLQDAIELDAVPVQLSKVQRSKVLIVALVGEDLVNVKEEAIRHVLRRLLVTVPIESI